MVIEHLQVPGKYTDTSPFAPYLFNLFNYNYPHLTDEETEAS